MMQYALAGFRLLTSDIRKSKGGGQESNKDGCDSAKPGGSWPSFGDCFRAPPHTILHAPAAYHHTRLIADTEDRYS